MDNELIVVKQDDSVLLDVQPLTEREKEFVDSVYALFDAFRDGNQKYRDEITEARKVYKLEDDQLDIGITDPMRRSPQLNTLNSDVDNMIADYMDNLPEAIVQPETAELAPMADDLTDVIGWTLHRANFKHAWRLAVSDATITGTGVLHAYWDDEMSLGDKRGGIGIQAWRPEYFMPDPLYDSLQDGRAVFKVCMHPLSYFEQHYPDKAKYIDPDAHVKLPSEELSRRDDQRYDDPLVALLECWFKRYDAKKKKYAVHMVQVAGGALLYDSRDDNPGGVYDHGQYPFVMLRFRDRENTCYGTGMMYEFADTQRMINRFTRYMDENARASARIRYIVNRNADLDMEAATDMNRDVILANVTDERAINQIQARPLNSQVMQTVQWLQDTEKQDSGQNQFSRGEGGLGVTAASAISMLQEAGGKITRLHTASYMDSFREMIEQIIALTAEFVDEERIVMITGDEHNEIGREVRLDGRSLKDSVLKRPALTVRVETQRSNPQQISSYNQLVLQMAEISAQAGSPIPAGTLMRAMRVPGKEEIVKLLDAADMQRQQMEQMQQQIQQLAAQNQQLMEQGAQMAQEMDAQKQMLGQTAQMLRGGGQQPPMQASQPPQAVPNYGPLEQELGGEEGA